jgi:trans-2,3-dihydro-3-hydroxyanthranilate isomerase
VQLPYHVVDVFAQAPFEGNPLAVVLDAESLSTEQMQRLADEFHLSETAFPMRPSTEEAARGVDYRLRIFTPKTELPFAGHPSVGTAWLMARLGRVAPGTVVQACGAGDLPLTVSADGGPVELTGGAPTWGEPVDPAPALAAVGLRADDLAGEPVRVAGTGLGYQILPVRAEALGRCEPEAALLRTFAHPTSDASGVYVTAWDPTTSTARARMFAGDLGIPEDPATGSAATAYGVWLAVSGLVPADGEARYTILQGVEMGRPSLLTCRVDVAGGRPTRARLSGVVEPIAEGRVTVPDA